MMSAESWKSNWEVVKRIGEGGQGTVDLVKRRSISDTTGDLHLKFRKTLQELTSNVFAAPPDHEKAAKELVDTLSLLTFRGAELGALKRLKNPETARDPRHAKFRQKREIDVLLKQTNPHLLRLLDVDQEQNWYVSAYCDGGDLRAGGSCATRVFPESPDAGGGSTVAQAEMSRKIGRQQRNGSRGNDIGNAPSVGNSKIR